RAGDGMRLSGRAAAIEVAIAGVSCSQGLVANTVKRDRAGARGDGAGAAIHAVADRHVPRRSAAARRVDAHSVTDDDRLTNYRRVGVIRGDRRGRISLVDGM